MADSVAELKGCDMLETPRNAHPTNGTVERLHGKVTAMHMDNQQATPFELGWLLGIIEGEGCIGLYPGSGGRVIHPLVRITNTDQLLIANACRILEKAGVGHHVRSSTFRPRGIRHDISIGGFMRIRTLLRLLMPEWKPSDKRQRAERVLQFCESRLSKRADIASRLRKVPYCEKELELYRLDRESPQRLMSNRRRTLQLRHLA